MNTFAIIRRVIWGLLLSGCIVIGGFYLALSQTILTKDGLRTVVTESKLADTVRDDVLLPRILQATRGSTYASLLDDTTVTKAVETAIPSDRLNKMLDPAVDATWRWLNSQEPEVHFSIPATSLSTSLATTLDKQVAAKVANLPACTLLSAYLDAETGLCQSRRINTEALTEKIQQIIKQDAMLDNQNVLTPESTGIKAALSGSASDLPSYLNMLYALSLVTAVAGGLITLWLLAKHRFAGIITIGGAGILAGISLYIVGIVATTRTGTLSDNTQLQLVARSAITLLNQTINHYALLVAGAGIIVAAIGSIGLYFWKKHHTDYQSVHLSDASDLPA